jgi:ABC-type uncharacterized transport system ATPase subunit
VLILKKGQMVFHGTLAEVVQKFSTEAGNVSLEEIFFRATADPKDLA